MAWDKARLLQKLRESYEYYYDIDDGDGGSGLRSSIALCSTSAAEGYVLVKQAKIWAAESNEYAYVFCTPHLDEETVGRCMDYALEDGLPRIVPDSEHRESYIIALFVADVIDKEAANAIRSRKYYRSFRLGSGLGRPEDRRRGPGKGVDRHKQSWE